MTCPGFLASPNPRTHTCARCARPRDRHPDYRPRDPALERHLTALAAQAAGRQGDGGLWAFADHRAHPGGVRTDADWDMEAAEELADCANYLVWGLVADWPGHLAGEPDATARFERRLRALCPVVVAWHELHTDAH